MQKTQVGPLDWKDPLEKEMATRLSVLAWEIPRTEEPGGLQSTGHKESDMTKTFIFSPLYMPSYKLTQSNCLESRPPHTLHITGPCPVSKNQSSPSSLDY